jgi:hypothetical protein
MEAFFLACFVFGALFTVVSVAMGLAGSLPGLHGGGPGHGGDLGHLGHAGDAGQLGDLGHAGHVGHAGDLGHGQAPSAVGHVSHVGGGADAGAPVAHLAGGDALQAPAHVDTAHPSAALERFSGALAVAGSLPLLSASSILAFLTWFGAAGYLLTRAAWPLLTALSLAVVAGFVAAVLVALFLRTVLVGSRAMNPDDYRLEGTLAHVTVTIPAGGTGEVVFTKAGTRRSEAARSAGGRAIPRGTEVVVLRYARGVARVQPFAELLAEEDASPRDGRGRLPAGPADTAVEPAAGVQEARKSGADGQSVSGDAPVERPERR